MSGLTRDWTAEPNSLELILRRERDRYFYPSCPANQEMDWKPHLVDAQSAGGHGNTRTHAWVMGQNGLCSNRSEEEDGGDVASRE